MEIATIVADELTAVSKLIYSPPLTVLKAVIYTPAGLSPMVEICQDTSWACTIGGVISESIALPDISSAAILRTFSRVIITDSVYWPQSHIDGRWQCYGPLSFSEPQFFRDLLIGVHGVVMREMDRIIRMLSTSPLTTEQLEQAMNAMAIVDHNYLVYMTDHGYLRLVERLVEH